jgi:hypothetical protein
MNVSTPISCASYCKIVPSQIVIRTFANHSVEKECKPEASHVSIWKCVEYLQPATTILPTVWLVTELVLWHSLTNTDVRYFGTQDMWTQRAELTRGRRIPRRGAHILLSWWIIVRNQLRRGRETGLVAAWRRHELYKELRSMNPKGEE